MGEMPANLLQERIAAIVKACDKPLAAPFHILTPDLQPGGCMPDLSTYAGQAAIAPLLEQVDLVIIDNIATLCRSGSENETESWKPVQNWALQIRSQGRAMLFIHHAGKKGLQRGSSSREDALSSVINLRRFEGYSPMEGAAFEVHYEKARGVHGEALEPFKAKLLQATDGKQYWQTESLTSECASYRQVAQLINEGYSQQSIADKLNLDKSTISRHAKRAKQEGLIYPAC